MGPRTAAKAPAIIENRMYIAIALPSYRISITKGIVQPMVVACGAGVGMEEALFFVTVTPAQITIGRPHVSLRHAVLGTFPLNARKIYSYIHKKCGNVPPCIEVEAWSDGCKRAVRSWLL